MFVTGLLTGGFLGVIVGILLSCVIAIGLQRRHRGDFDLPPRS